jgi:hypothetical protein
MKWNNICNSYRFYLQLLVSVWVSLSLFQIVLIGTKEIRQRHRSNGLQSASESATSTKTTYTNYVLRSPLTSLSANESVKKKEKMLNVKLERGAN